VIWIIIIFVVISNIIHQTRHHNLLVQLSIEHVLPQLNMILPLFLAVRWNPIRAAHPCHATSWLTTASYNLFN
jgi:hypothetical protein